MAGEMLKAALMQDKLMGKKMHQQVGMMKGKKKKAPMKGAKGC